MFASSFSAEVSGLLGPGLAVGGGGASPFLNGVTVMKGAGNIPSGSSPGMVMPQRGIEADRVRMNTSAKQRSCESVSRKGRIAARRLVSSRSLHCVQMPHGAVGMLGGMNIRPNSGGRDAGCRAKRRTCVQSFSAAFDGRLRI